MIACLIIRALRLEIELQRELNVSRGLRRLNNSGGRLSHRRIGYREVDAVKRIQEVCTELESESLADLEVLLQAGIPVVVSRAPQTAQLRCTVPESGRWVRIVAGVKPSEAATLRCGSV